MVRLIITEVRDNIGVESITMKTNLLDAFELRDAAQVFDALSVGQIGAQERFGLQSHSFSIDYGIISEDDPVIFETADAIAHRRRRTPQFSGDVVVCHAPIRHQ